MRARYKPFVTIALLVCALVILAPRVNAQTEGAAQILQRINQARAQANLPPLTRNPELDAAAQTHAQDLLEHGAALGHRGSDGSNISQRIARAGYAGDAVGENWASYRTLDKIFEFWLNDPPHRKNILEPRYREIGIGVAMRANGGWIVVTDFGARTGSAKAVQAESAPKQKKAKPTLAPTRKPTLKPTVPPTQVPPTRKPQPKPTAVPPPAPTTAPIVQVAVAPAAPKPKIKPLRVRAKIARVSLQGSAGASQGNAAARGDVGRMLLGGALSMGGVMLLGLAVVGQSRRTRRCYF